MKIAYITINDPKDYKSWSGLNYSIYKSLKSAGNDVVCIGPLNQKIKIFYVIIRYIYSLFGIKFDADRSVILSKYYCAQVKKKINNQKFDLILTSDTTTVAYLDTNIPIVIWLDTMFQSWYSHYYSKKKISQKTYEEGNLCEQNAINKASNILLTSQWAKNEVFKFYKCKKNKINVLPFGSNLENSPTLGKITKKKYTIKDKCKIISVGVDWERKGFVRTIGICNLIRKKGLNVELTIIGASTNKSNSFPNWVKIYKFLDKNKKNSRQFISKHLLESDFHLLMTKSEAFGVVFVEASAYGVFNIAPNIGGIKGAIKNNINGKLFNPSIKNQKIANYIYNSYLDKKRLRNKMISSKIFYDRNLNWNVIGLKFNKIIINKVLN